MDVIVIVVLTALALLVLWILGGVVIMAGDIDIDSIIKVMSDPKAGANLQGFMETMKEVNKALQEVQKTVDFLDRCGVKPLLVRAAGKKLGVDVDTPLEAEKQFKPKSQTHAQIYNHLNQLPEEEVAKMFTKPEDVEDGSTD